MLHGFADRSGGQLSTGSTRSGALSTDPAAARTVRGWRTHTPGMRDRVHRRRWPLAVFLVVCVALLSVAIPAEAGPRSVTGGWPLTGRPVLGRGFDPPATPWARGHRGVDLPARLGGPVLATGPGRVAFVGTVAGRGVVTIDHGNGLTTTYEPVSARVAVGDPVSAGQVVGVVGRGSHCATTCLHWGLKQGDRYLDPVEADEVPDGPGSLRLVPESRRAEVQREAAARAAAQAAAEAAAGAMGIIGPVGASGRHGFLRPVAAGITSPYGRRFHPVLRVWKLHDGTDFGAACGAAIWAPYAGRVTRAYFNPGYGNRLLLDHGTVDGQHVVTAYNHAARFVVGSGARVRRGQVIGFVGTTGYSTGCHLHLMVWLSGRLVNPMTWF